MPARPPACCSALPPPRAADLTPAAEVVEGALLHAFEGRAPFSERTLEKIAQLRAVYELELTAEDSHRLEEG